MKKRDFETYRKFFRDFKILTKFSETHVFRGTIRHPLLWCTIREACNPNLQVVFTHVSHICSQHSFGLPLRMNGMNLKCNLITRIQSLYHL